MEDVNLGAEVIQLLIPQRRPLLMVDRIRSFSITPNPSICCIKYISANESFFEGHYPTLAIMPGALTFEGLGQSANLLAALVTLHEQFILAGEDPDTLKNHLKNLQYGYTLNRAYRPRMAAHFEKIVKNNNTGPEFGMVGAVNMKFLEPVFAGSLVEYRANLTTLVDKYMYFEVEATIDNQVKAKGTLSTIKGLGVHHHLANVKGNT